MILKGKYINLRALEPNDLGILYQWENDPEIWTISNTQTPYSKHMLTKFIEASLQDIYTAKQLRLMMDENETGETIGIIDLFDFEPFHGRVGVGILIDKDHRKKGFASEGIRLVKDYVFEVLQIHQIYCNIMEGNDISIALFQKEGFEIMGNKKDWIKTKEGYQNELFLQCLNK